MRSLKVAAWFICLAVPVVLNAQIPFAGEDFDSGTTNGGFTAVTEIFSPDNRDNPLTGDSPLDDGGFTSSGFDLFGETSRSGSFVPFDILDDSLTFPDDDFGILRSGKTDRVVAISDTENRDNSGPVTASWTFDISNRSNIQLSLDAAMLGDFDATDSFEFRYSIDGAPSQSAFSIAADEDNPSVFYEAAFEAGTTADRYFIPGAFFNEIQWIQLTQVGESATANRFFHPLDNGEGLDTVARDGFVEVEGLNGITQERALSFNGFDNIEREAFQDPLFVNGDSFDGVQLTNEFTTLSALVEGTGSVLTLELTAFSDGTQEYFLFDNLLLSELELPGDFNGDNVVSTADYAVWRDNIGNSDDSALNGNGDETSGVGEGDYLLWLENVGTRLTVPIAALSSPNLVAIPEPTSVTVAVLLASIGVALRGR